MIWYSIDKVVTVKKTPTYIIFSSDHIKLDLKSNLMEAPHYLMVYVGVFMLYRLKVVIYIELVELSFTGLCLWACIAHS